MNNLKSKQSQKPIRQDKDNYDLYIWENKNFPNKTLENEDIILLVREDIAILALKGLVLYSVFFVALVAKLVIGNVDNASIIDFYNTALYSLGSILTLIFLIIFHNYYLSLQIITSERIIDIDQTSIFRREVNTTPIENIQDVSYKKTGFLPFLFNFGNLILETSGESVSELGKDNMPNGIVFNNIPEPAEVAHLINELEQKDDLAMAEYKAKLEAKELAKVLKGRILN